MSDEPNFLLITTYIPVLCIISRSIALILSSYCYWFLISNFSGLVSWILSYVFFDTHIFKDSLYDKNVGWMHGVAFGLIVNVPRVQTGLVMRNFDFVFLDSAWCVVVSLNAWFQSMHYHHPERSSMRNGIYLTYVASTACLLGRLTLTAQTAAFVESIFDFVMRTAMYFAVLSVTHFTSNPQEHYMLTFWVHTCLFYCNLYMAYACAFVSLLCIWRVTPFKQSDTKAGSCVVNTGTTRGKAPDPELALAKSQKIVEQSQMEIDKASKASIKTSDDESSPENISEVQAELRQLLRHKNM